MANEREKQKGNINIEKGATNLAFNRLGTILHEIARDAANNSDSTEGGEGGDAK